MAGIIELGFQFMQMGDQPLQKLIKDLEKTDNLFKSLSESDIKDLLKQYDTLDDKIKNVNKQTEVQKQIMKEVSSETKKSAKESASAFELSAKKLEEAKNIQVQLLDVEQQLYFAKKKNLTETTGLLEKYQKKLIDGFELDKVELKMLEKTKIIENDIIKTKEKSISKLNSQKEKAYNQDYENQSKLMSLEIKLAKAGLTQQYKDQLDYFKKTEGLRKEDVRDFEHAINMQIATMKDSKSKLGFGDNLVMSAAQLLTFTKAIQVVKDITAQMRELDRSVFNMGVVAGESVPRIREMRGELLEMASTLPTSATDLAKAIDMVERTGLKYGDALKIVSSGAKAAIASGEDLQAIVSIVNKAMLGFKINADEANEVFEMFHSTVLNSPLDFQKLGAAMGQSASIFGLFIDSTSRSGKALEDYKKELLGVSSTLTAIQAFQGRAAGSSGVTIRTMLSKLLAMEKTAEKLFNTEAKMNNIMYKDTQLTADRLSQLAKEDLPEAINLISKLYSQGELSYKTLSKVFTVRHAPYILQSMLEINGNLEEYTKRITTGRSVSEDFEKQMQSWDNTLKRTKQNFDKLLNVGQNFLDKWGVPALKILNKVTDAFNGLANNKLATTMLEMTIMTGGVTKGLFAMGNVISSIGNGFTTLISNIGTFAKATEGASIAAKVSLLGVGNVLTIVAAIAITTGMLMYQSLVDQEQKSLKMAAIYNKQAEKIQNQLSNMQKLRVETDNLYKTIYNISKTDLFKKDEMLILIPDIAKEINKIEEEFKKISLDDMIIEDFKIANIDTVSDYIRPMTEAQSKVSDMVAEFNNLSSSISNFSAESSNDINRFIELIDELDVPVSKTQSNILNMYSAMSKTKDIGTARDDLRKFQESFDNLFDKNKEKELKDFFRKKNRTLDLSFVADVKRKGVDEALKKAKKYLAKGYWDNIESDLEAFEKKFGTTIDKFIQNEDLDKFLIKTATQLKDLGFDIEINIDQPMNMLDEINKIVEQDNFNQVLTDRFSEQRKIYEESIKDSANYLKEQFENITKWADSVENYLIQSNTNIRKYMIQKSDFENMPELSEMFKGTDLESIVDDVDHVLSGVSDVRKMVLYTSNEFWQWGAGLRSTEAIITQTQNAMDDMSKKAKELKIDNLSMVDIEKKLYQYRDKLKNVSSEILDKSRLTQLTDKQIRIEAERLGITQETLVTYLYLMNKKINKEATNNKDLKLEQLKLMVKQKEALFEIFKKNESYAQKLAEYQMKELKGLDLIKAKRDEINRSGIDSKINLDIDMENVKATIKKDLKGLNELTDVEILMNVPVTDLKSLDNFEKKIEELQKRYKADGQYTENEEKAIKALTKLRDQHVKTLESQLDVKNKLADNDKEESTYIDNLNKKYDNITKSIQEALKYDGKKLTNMEKLDQMLKEQNLTSVSISKIDEELRGKQAELLKQKEKNIELDDEKIKKLEKEIKDLLEIKTLYITINNEQKSTIAKMTKSYSDLEKQFKKVLNPEKIKPLRDQLDEINKQIGEYNVTYLEESSGTNVQQLQEINKQLENKNDLTKEEHTKLQQTLNQLGLEEEDVKKIIELYEKKQDVQSQINKQTKEMVNMIGSIISDISKGVTLKFNADTAISGAFDTLGNVLTGQLEGGVLHTEDYMSLISGAMGIMDNVMKQQIQSQIQQLEWENKLLAAKKQSAKNEEELRIYERQELENQKKMIDLQYQQQNAFMGISGIEGSALSGISQGAMTGFMLGGGVGSLVGGIAGGISGIIGGNEAKKQAEEAKKQAEFLYRLNTLIQDQNKILEDSKEFLSSISSNLRYGSERALETAFGSIEFTGIDLSIIETLESLIDELTSSSMPLDLNVDPLIDGIQNDIDILNEAQKVLSVTPELGWTEQDYNDQIESLNEVKEELNSMYDGASEEQATYLDTAIDATEQQITQLENLKKLIEEIGSIYALSNIGFTIDIKDDGSFEVIWEGRADYLEGIIDGTVNLAEMTAESIGMLWKSSLVDSNKAIDESLNNLEGLWKIASQELDETGKISQGTMIGIVNETENLAQAQDEIAKQIWTIKDAYVRAGGSAEDFYNAMGIDLETDDYWRELLNLGLYTNEGAKGIQEINELLRIQREEVQGLAEDNQRAMQAWLSGDIEGTWDEVKFMFDQTVVEMVETLKDGFSEGNLGFIYDSFYNNISNSIKDSFSEESMMELGNYIQQMSDQVTNLIEDGDIEGAAVLTQQMEKFNNVSEMSNQEIHDLVFSITSLPYEEKLVLERWLQYQKSIEEANSELEDTLTLTERIAENTSLIGQKFEEYITYLYDGSFEAESFAELLETIYETQDMKLESEKLSVATWIDLAKLGAITGEVLSKMPQSLQDTVSILSDYDYYLGVGNDELTLADQLWNSQVGHIKDKIKADYIQAMYQEDIAKIEDIRLKIQEDITKESTKQLRIDEKRVEQAKLFAQAEEAYAMGEYGAGDWYYNQGLEVGREITSIEAEVGVDWEYWHNQLDTVISDMANKIQNDPTLQNIDKWFGDRTIEDMNDVKDAVEDLGSEFKSIFDFLSDANNELKETIDFWFEGGKILVDGEIVGDYKTSIEDINEKYKEQEKITESIAKNTDELRKLWTSGELKVPLQELIDYLDEIDNAIYNIYSQKDFGDFGKNMIETMLQGMEEAMVDYMPQSILDYSENMKNLYISSDVAFDDDFIRQLEIINSLGEEFNDLTLDDIKNTNTIKNLLNSIGYANSDITEEVITQFQKYLGIQLILDQNNDSAEQFTQELFKQEQILNGINKYEDELGKFLDQFNMDDQAKAMDDIERGVEEINRLMNIDVTLDDILNFDISKIQSNVKTSRDLLYNLFPELQEGIDFTIDYDTQQVEFLGDQAEERAELYEKEVGDQEKSEQILMDILGLAKDLNDTQEDINEQTESYVTIFQRLSDQQSKFKETLEFWFRGGQRLLDDKVVGDYTKSINEVNKEFEAMIELENMINEDSIKLMELWGNGQIKAEVQDIVEYFSEIGQTIQSSLMTALDSDNFLDIASTLGSDISSALAEGFKYDLLNDKFKDEYLQLTEAATQAMTSGSLQDIVSLSTEIQSLAAKVEYENAREKALLDVLDYNAEINYATQNTQIEYSTGSTKENVYNITYNTTVTTGAFVTDSYNGAQKIFDEFGSHIVQSLEKLGYKMNK